MDSATTAAIASATPMAIAPAPIDHLVFHAPVPERTRTSWWLRTGVDPDFGGAHVEGGTANWLAGLGDGAYLELLGPQPEKPARDRAAFIRTNPDELFGFAVAVEDARAVADRLVAAGLEVDGPREGGRMLSDGTTLAWHTVAVLDTEFGAYIPFCIQWLAGGPHPSETAPQGLCLDRFVVEHPEAERLSAIYRLIGATVRVRQAAQPAMRAEIVGPHGRLTLGRLSPPGHGC